MFVAKCSDANKAFFVKKDVTWEEIVSGAIEPFFRIVEDPSLGDDGKAKALDKLGFPTDASGIAYGFSKACLNSYTMALSRKHPNLLINACSPGFIETDLTRPYAEKSGKTPEQMGMLPPEKVCY